MRRCASHASHSLTAWGSGQKYGNLKAGRRGQQGGQEVQTPLNQLLRASGTGPGDHCGQGRRCAAHHMHLPNSLSLCSPSVKEATTHESLTQSYHGACLLLSLCGRTEALSAAVAAEGCLLPRVLIQAYTLNCKKRNAPQLNERGLNGSGFCQLGYCNCGHLEAGTGGPWRRTQWACASSTSAASFV